MRMILTIIAACAVAVIALARAIPAAVAQDTAQATDEKADKTPPPDESSERAKNDPAYVLDYRMKRLDGKLADLRTYEGRVVLMVNTASKCGLTPQYEGLEKLYHGRKDKGLVVLGFPANNFGNQEPGTNEQIAAFCKQNYGVTFPMFAKVSVKGDDTCRLYKRLAKQPEPIGVAPNWNFTKFLVDRTGRVVARFGPRTRPDDEKMLKHIDELLAQRIIPEQGRTAGGD